MKDVPTILRLRNVTKWFGGLKAVDSVTIDFRERKITGLIGPNGAGKTTLFNLINGFLRPDSGEIYYRNIRIDHLMPWEIAKLGIGRLFQDVRIFRKLTVLENVLTGKPSHPGEALTPLLFSLRKVRKIEAHLLDEAHHWIEFVGLTGKEHAPAESLSYGQQKLLSLARLLVGGYDLLLLDEPTAGVNPIMARKILDIIKKMVTEEGKTVIFIEHNMNVVVEIADWVYFLDEGKLAGMGRPQDILGDVNVRKAYLGI